MTYFDQIFWALVTGYAILIVIILNLAREHLRRINERQPDEHEQGLLL